MYIFFFKWCTIVLPWLGMCLTCLPLMLLFCKDVEDFWYNTLRVCEELHISQSCFQTVSVNVLPFLAAGQIRTAVKASQCRDYSQYPQRVPPSNTKPFGTAPYRRNADSFQWPMMTGGTPLVRTNRSLHRWREAGPLSSLVPGSTFTHNLWTEGENRVNAWKRRVSVKQTNDDKYRRSESTHLSHNKWDEIMIKSPQSVSKTHDINTHVVMAVVRIKHCFTLCCLQFVTAHSVGATVCPPLSQRIT